MYYQVFVSNASMLGISYKEENKMIMRPKEDWIAIGIVGIFAFLICSIAHAEVNDTQATKAIIGEALSDYDSMYAIACALRNRDTLQGVYGLHSKQVKLATGEVYQRAGKAWANSEDGIDVVQGATHWLSDYDLKHCKKSLTAFRFAMTETAYIGQTHFYRKEAK